MDNPLSPAVDSRFGQRITFNQDVVINKGSFGTIKNISTSGCYVETKKIFGLGQEVHLRFYLSAPQLVSIETKARVIHLRPGEGFGVKFQFDSENTVKTVQQFVNFVAENSKP
ncbi:MAG: PilZ domain-containing protein [Nitrospirae bacterium]|nr:PilZ domain-containing protein [Nitrospirota bacterium]